MTEPINTLSPATAILAALPTCVKVLSPTGLVRYVNPTGLALLEANAASDVLGRQYADLWPPALRPRVTEAIRGAAHGKITRVEGLCPTLKGTLKWWQTEFRSTSVEPSGDPEIVGVSHHIAPRDEEAAHLTDELGRLGAELAQAERRRSEFVAMLAHELRNPLAPIRSGLQLIRKADGQGAAVIKARDMIERQVVHMIHLLNDLLDTARLTNGKLNLRRELVDVREIVAAAVEASAPFMVASRHNLAVDMLQFPLMLAVDPTRLIQVLTNLLHNAAKYTPAGGHLAISMQEAGDELHISVTDSGIGVAPESLARIFEMFTTIGPDASGTEAGLGVGLHLARRVVELHGGRIVAQSDGLGCGSRFCVILPLTRPRRELALDNDATACAPGKERNFRVLVVDDNADAAESLSMLLQSDNHTTRVANTGRDALRVVVEFKPDVVFLDIGMPDMDGYEVANALRGIPEARGAKLVALTGWGGHGDRARTKSAGFHEHLTKPADFSTIEAILSRLIH